MILSLTFNNASLNHLVVKIVTLSGALSDTSEHGVSSVVHGNVVNQFHDNHLYVRCYAVSVGFYYIQYIRQ